MRPLLIFQVTTACHISEGEPVYEQNQLFSEPLVREIKPEEVDAFRKQFSGSQAERGGASGGGQKPTQKLDAGKFKPLLEDAVKAQSQVADRCDH